MPSSRFAMAKATPSCSKSPALISAVPHSLELRRRLILVSFIHDDYFTDIVTAVC